MTRAKYCYFITDEPRPKKGYSADPTSPWHLPDTSFRPEKENGSYRIIKHLNPPPKYTNIEEGEVFTWCPTCNKWLAIVLSSRKKANITGGIWAKLRSFRQ